MGDSAVEMESQNISKTGQSTATSSTGGGSSIESSAINNNLMISKKPTGVAKKLNYRQSSLDFDNRTSACKLIDNNSNNSLLGNKSFLAVPRLQATTRSRSGSAKQLFKQAAIVDEDEHTNENSLLLPESNATASSQPCIPQLQLPIQENIASNAKSMNEPLPPISVISSSVGGQQIKVTEPALMHTLTVDDDVDGNVKKSESCELLRVISERRKL